MHNERLFLQWLANQNKNHSLANCHNWYVVYAIICCHSHTKNLPPQAFSYVPLASYEYEWSSVSDPSHSSFPDLYLRLMKIHFVLRGGGRERAYLYCILRGMWLSDFESPVSNLSCPDRATAATETKYTGRRHTTNLFSRLIDSPEESLYFI